MRQKINIRLFAALLLGILLAANVGHKIHIFTEDPLHYAGFAGDLVPDNGATKHVSALCLIDDYYFFPFLEASQPPHHFYTEVLAIITPQPTQQKLAVTERTSSLRAPPVCLI